MANSSSSRKANPEKIPFAKPLVNGPVKDASPGPAKIPFPAASGARAESSTPQFAIQVSSETNKSTAGSERGKRPGGNSRKLTFLVFGFIGLLSLSAAAGVAIYMISNQETPRAVAKATKKKPSKPVAVSDDAESNKESSGKTKPLPLDVASREHGE